ncbi:hypothetical protein P879_10747 [Paragonimus westermani]|uniref:C2H2-type domain-containing protein n=1 Tax=Paragonimus westermani TaxID=34504 RepID=A0A8T0DGR9_9TREM|nr:hypothetical protein P879_10747 [Paragonimus westermani]
MQERSQIGEYKRPVGQTSVCILLTPALESPDSGPVGSQTLPMNAPASAGANPSSSSINTSHQYPGCTGSFKTIPGLNKHFNTHNRNPTLHLTTMHDTVFRYRCSQCRLQFTSDRALSRNTGEKPIQQSTTLIASRV